MISGDCREGRPEGGPGSDWGEEGLIPRSVRETGAVRHQPTPMAVVNLPKVLQVHPPTVAGPARYELQQCGLLSQSMGTDALRRHLEKGA